MKSILRTGTGLLTAASVAFLPVQATAQSSNYDPVLYDLLLDCVALQVLFAQAADKEADKTRAANDAVGYMTAAQQLSGVEIKELGPVLSPRRTKILGMLDKKDGSAERLVKSCAAIMKVGVDAKAAAATK